MNSLPRPIKVATLVLVALVLALTPLLGVACGDNGVEDEMTLIFQSPYPEADVTGLAAKKFKELLEEKTDGKVTVQLNYGGTLMDHTKQLEGLAAGTVDVVIQHPGYSRAVNPNFDYAGSLQGLMVDKAHFAALVSDPTFLQFIQDLYGTKGVHFVGYLETFLGAIYLTKTEMDSLSDFNGKVGYNGRPGSPEPVEAMLGLGRIYVTPTEVSTNINNGNITMQITQMTLAASSGDYTNWNYGLIRWVYSPNTILIAKAKWDAMSADLQDLITNEVFPEVAAYESTQVVQVNKEALKKLNDNLDKINVVTRADESQVWSQLENYPAFTAKAASMDQTILALVKSKRPTTSQFDSDQKAIMNYAGVTIP